MSRMPVCNHPDRPANRAVIDRTLWPSQATEDSDVSASQSPHGGRYDMNREESQKKMAEVDRLPLARP